MKSVIYTYINRFWSGKCFLLRANAKKDMRELFEKDFSEPKTINICIYHTFHNKCFPALWLLKKFINDKLLSKSYQAGFENIKHDIEMQEV